MTYIIACIVYGGLKLALSLEELKKLRDGNWNTRNKDGIDKLGEINDKKYCYNISATIIGNHLEIKTYDKLIYTNYKQDSFEENYNAEEVADTTNGSDGIDEEDKAAYNRRSNRRRRNKLKNILKANSNLLTTYITLTLGSIDYKNLVENACERLFKKEDYHPIGYPYPAFYFEKDKMEKLKGLKKINKCEAGLREKVIEFLSHQKVMAKRRKAEEIVEEKWGGEIETKYKNQEIKREIPRQLDELICNGDPFDINECQMLFDRFRRRMNDFLKKNDEGEVNNFEYIKTTELQKSGRIHFHLLSNLPYIPQWKLQKKWDNGIVNIQNIQALTMYKDDITIREKDTIDKKLSKLAKYLTKKMENSTATRKNNKRVKLKDNQLYSYSSGIRRPLRITSTVLIDNVIRKYLNKAHYKPDYEDYVSGSGEYSRNFYLEIYNLESENLHEKLNDIENQLLDRIIELTEERGQKEAGQDIFEQAIKEADLPLQRDFMRFSS